MECNREIHLLAIMPRGFTLLRASIFSMRRNNTLFPETGRPVVILWEWPGVKLDFNPRQTCWDQMHAINELRSEACSLARRIEMTRGKDNTDHSQPRLFNTFASYRCTVLSHSLPCGTFLVMQ